MTKQNKCYEAHMATALTLPTAHGKRLARGRSNFPR